MFTTTKHFFFFLLDSDHLQCGSQFLWGNNLNTFYCFSFGFQGEDLLKKRGLETYPTQLIGGEGHLHLTENFQIAFLLIAPESGKEMADEDQMIGDFFLTHVMISNGISLIA